MYIPPIAAPHSATRTRTPKSFESSNPPLQPPSLLPYPPLETVAE